MTFIYTPDVLACGQGARSLEATGAVHDDDTKTRQIAEAPLLCRAKFLIRRIRTETLHSVIIHKGTGRS
jgi:hypothetical protein